MYKRISQFGICLIALLLTLCAFMSASRSPVSNSVSAAAPDESPTVSPTATPSATPAPDPLATPKVYVDLIDPKTVSDTVGKRIAKRFVALQVTISNENPTYQFLIHDISLDMGGVMNSAAAPTGILKDYYNELVRLRQERDKMREGGEGMARVDGEIEELRERYAFRLSSMELGVLRGVAEKGQLTDRRNFILRVLRAIGTLAGGFTGVTTLGASYAPAVAFFNGPGLNAYQEAFPDFTVNQLNRLNDLAYRSNTLVPRQQAKVMIAFIPQALFMDKDTRKQFWHDPIETFDKYDFRRTAVIVNGSYITEVENLPVRLTSIQIAADEMKKFQNVKPEVKGSIIGQGLKNAKIDLISPSPEFAERSIEGTSTDTHLDFVLKLKKPVTGPVVVAFQVIGNDGLGSVISNTFFYTASPTTLDDNQSVECAPDDKKCKITIKGQHFSAELKADAFSFSIPELKVGSVTDVTDTTAVLHVDTTGIKGTYELRLNGATGVVKFILKKPEQ